MVPNLHLTEWKSSSEVVWTAYKYYIADEKEISFIVWEIVHGPNVRFRKIDRTKSTEMVDKNRKINFISASILQFCNFASASAYVLSCN